MRTTSTLLGTAAAVTLLVASAAAPVSAGDCAIHGTCCFPAKSSAVAWKRSSIEAVLDRVTVSDGGLDRIVVRRALLRQAAPVEACFEPGSAVAVNVVFVISPAGTLHRAAATSIEPRLATCVATAMVKITFPVSRDFTVTEVTATITARTP